MKFSSSSSSNQKTKSFVWIRKQDRIPESNKAKLIERDNKHYYQTPQSHIYPSATTMLSATMSEEKKNKLQEWKERNGDQKANEISKRATDIGTLLHKLAEEYLNNFEIIQNNENSNDEKHKIALRHFKQLQTFLNKIDHIHETEVPLYHDYLMFAGTADCIAEYDGVLSIIDFKTSKSEKLEEWIEDYFLQATLYSMMYYNLTGIKVSQIVILISGEEDNSANVFVKNVSDYVNLVFERIHKFNNMEARI